MAVDKFPAFAKMVADSFQEMTKTTNVFVVDLDGSALFEQYLKSFPEEKQKAAGDPGREAGQQAERPVREGTAKAYCGAERVVPINFRCSSTVELILA
jgi:hypothetical protein